MYGVKAEYFTQSSSWQNRTWKFFSTKHEISFTQNQNYIKKQYSKDEKLLDGHKDGSEDGYDNCDEVALMIWSCLVVLLPDRQMKEQMDISND